MPTIHITLLGRFAVTVDGVPVADGQLDAPPRGRAREGARAGARPAPAPRADHRSRVARRHDRRGRAEAAQGRALRPARDRRARLGRAARRQRRAVPRRRRDRRRRARSRSSRARRSPTTTSWPPATRSRSTAASCCPRTATRSGPRSGASSCASATSTCCASTAAGRRWSSSTRATSSPTSRSCAATPPTATATPRCASSNAWTARCAASSASRPGRDAVALRDRLLAEHDVAPRRDDALVGRDAELRDRRARAASTPPPGRSRTLIVSGPAGVGKSSLLARHRRPGERARLPRRARHLGAGRRARGRTRRSSRRSPTCAGGIPTLLDGLSDHHREEIDRALAGRRDRVDRRELAPAAVRRRGRAGPRSRRRRNGLLLTIDDVHDADDASLRLAPLHRPLDARPARVHRAHPPARRRSPTILAETRQSLIDRHGATEIELGPLGDDDVAALVRRHVAEPAAELIEQIAALSGGIPFAVERARPARRRRAAVGAGARRQHDRRHRAGDP